MLSFFAFAFIIIINAFGNISAQFGDPALTSVTEVADQMQKLNQILCDFLYGHNISGLLDLPLSTKSTYEDGILLKQHKSDTLTTGITSKPVINVCADLHALTVYCLKWRWTDTEATAFEQVMLHFHSGARSHLLKPTKLDQKYPHFRDRALVRKQISKRRSAQRTSGALFLNKSRVQIPQQVTSYPLQITHDYMQTAVNAFSILISGTIEDLRALPGDYVLRSARTISMLQLPREKLVAMWDVVLHGRDPQTITRESLEMYRPLMKYLSGKQLARLNLSNSGIINYIGTHPDLNRHQMGVVASKYIKLNPDWRQVKFLNNMNNLLCGFPMSYMRKVEDDVYFVLDHQAFYHVRACDRLQRRFFLNTVTRSRGMGKSSSWTARDVSRLGLLMVVVNDQELGRITPEAMTGLSSYVMVELHAESLMGLSDLQIKYLKPKAKNILAQKLKKYLKAGSNC